MSWMRSSLPILLLASLAGCEFNATDANLTPERSRTGIRNIAIEWADSTTSFELGRVAKLQDSNWSVSIPTPMSEPPSQLVLRGLADQTDVCSARIWVNGQRTSNLECVSIPDKNEVLVRGLDLALPPREDGLHPLRIDSGTQRLTLDVRTIPNQLSLSAETRSASFQSLGAENEYHQIGSVVLPRVLSADLQIQAPAVLDATIIRPITKYDYSFDFIRCALTQASQDQSETIQLTIHLIPVIDENHKLEEDWPRLLTLESHTLQLGRTKATRILIYAKHPFLDVVFGTAPFKTSASVQHIEKQCSPNRSEFSAPSASISVPRNTFGDFRIGRDENDPILKFDFDNLIASDLASSSVDMRTPSVKVQTAPLQITLTGDRK